MRPRGGWHSAAVGVVRSENVMAKKAERPKEPLMYGNYMKHIAIASVIMGGAVLWGYAVYSVAIRTL